MRPVNTWEVNEKSVEQYVAELVRRLRGAGISRQAIEAAWPSWWCDGVGPSASGRAELRFALARRLGLWPKSLVGERVEFIWDDQAHFKNVSVRDPSQRAALTSFGVVIGRLLIRATPPSPALESIDAASLRQAILRESPFVDLRSLLSVCWGLGVPVVFLRTFPLENQGMHAMVVRSGGRYAVLLGRNAHYPAPVAFTLAHELGHVFLGHLVDAAALVDVGDPASRKAIDTVERDADEFGLELLTSRTLPAVELSLSTFNAPSLAKASLSAAGHYQIEPGTIALIVGHEKHKWPLAVAALDFIYDKPRPVWREVNSIADSQLNFREIGDDAEDYLKRVMGASN